MSSPSNLYAEKIYSEHPLALWALDDNVDYLSLITESQREISSPAWIVEGVDNYYEGNTASAPFQDSIINTIEGTPNSLVVLKSPDLVSLENLHDLLGTLCVGMYYYSNSDNYDYIEIGYEYEDSQTGLNVENVKRFSSVVQDRWVFLSNTFDIPDETNPFRLVVKIQLNNAGSSSADYVFSFNGMSVGQWSEEFNTTSLGSTAIDLPNDIGLKISNLKCIESSSYGSNTNKAYYIIANNVLTAKNTSIPLVYGSSGLIRLLPNYDTQIDQIIDGGPALTTITEFIDGGTAETTSESIIDGGVMYPVPSYIIPALGLLNDSGKYKEYSLEFWARIDCNAYIPQRVLGPISSKDGVYIDKSHITLVIGDNFKSHFVGKWGRPMLIHINLDKNGAQLLINGEEVISMSFDISTVDLPLITDSNNKNQDFLGFFAYPDIPSFEIDSVSIYSYKMPIIMAKRRFVYGQGVGSSELINNSYSGNEAFIDYTFAEYSADYNYPDFARWDQATFDNMETNKLSLSTPNYSLPTIYLSNKTVQDLYVDSKNIQDEENKFISFRPNNSWSSTVSYLNFPRLDILQTPVKMIYAIISSSIVEERDQVLLKIYSSINSDYLSIILSGEDIIYNFSFNGTVTELYRFGHFATEKSVIGFKIDELSSSNNNIYSFFNNPSSLRMYVGGEETGDHTFSGRIYSVGFGSEYNAATFEHFENGIVDEAEHMYFLDKLASYTLLPTAKYDSFFLDIGISSYWEDYVPLSYFAKYVDDGYGATIYDLDFLQFNIDYPAPTTTVTEDTSSEWIYSELNTQFDSPVQKTYYQLDNENYTNWNNYGDMEQRVDRYRKYDLSNNEVKVYTTMQYILDGANLLQNNFTTTTEINENKVIDFSKHPNWQNHRFETIDSSIIYPPSNVDFNNLAIVYRVEINSRGILNRPISIKSVQLASQAFNYNSSNPIGTRFGSSIYPYSKTGIYYDYKSKNPFAISKDSAPYLYVTNDSGIEIRGDYEKLIEKGMAISINSGQSANFKVSAMQFWVRSNRSKFPAVKQKMFEVSYLGDSLEFYIEANSSNGDRARIFASLNSTGQPFLELKYYVNGNFVREPVISIKEWACIGIAFNKNLNFDNFLGAINITGQYSFNNIAYYQATNLQLAQSRVLQSWSKIKSLAEIDKDWEDWLSYTWDQALVIGTSDLYGTNPSDIYKTYIGTNKVIIDDNAGLSVDSEVLRFYKDSVWQSYVNNPV